MKLPLTPTKGSVASPITEAEWDRIEQAVGAPVPLNIRLDLATVVGRRFVDVDASIPIVYPKGPSINDIFLFLGSLSCDPSYSIYDVAISLQPLGSDRRYLPFAQDAGGNYFVVRLDGPRPGSVALIDFDYEPMSEEAIVIGVAPTIDAFLQTIELTPDQPV